MTRPITITDEQILDAARAVFLKEGFGAQTAKIARRAGISEGTIFKRFQTKEGLFLAALDIASPPAWHELSEELVGVGDVKENMALVAGGILLFMLETMPRVFALMGHPTVKGDHNFMGELHRRDVQVLSTYLGREIELGRLCRCDSETLTHVILGAVVDYTMRTMTKQIQITVPDAPQAFAQGVIGLLWNGIAPKPA